MDRTESRPMLVVPVGLTAHSWTEAIGSAISHLCKRRLWVLVLGPFSVVFQLSTLHSFRTFQHAPSLAIKLLPAIGALLGSPRMWLSASSCMATHEGWPKPALSCRSPEWAIGLASKGKRPIPGCTPHLIPDPPSPARTQQNPGEYLTVVMK